MILSESKDRGRSQERLSGTTPGRTTSLQTSNVPVRSEDKVSSVEQKQRIKSQSTAQTVKEGRQETYLLVSASRRIVRRPSS